MLYIQILVASSFYSDIERSCNSKPFELTAQVFLFFSHAIKYCDAFNEKPMKSSIPNSWISYCTTKTANTLLYSISPWNSGVLETSLKNSPIICFLSRQFQLSCQFQFVQVRKHSVCLPVFASFLNTSSTSTSFPVIEKLEPCAESKIPIY